MPRTSWYIVRRGISYSAVFDSQLAIVVGVVVVVVVVEVAGVSLTTTLEAHYHFTSNRHLSAIRPSLSVSLLGRFGF